LQNDLTQVQRELRQKQFLFREVDEDRSRLVSELTEQNHRLTLQLKEVLCNIVGSRRKNWATGVSNKHALRVAFANYAANFPDRQFVFSLYYLVEGNKKQKKWSWLHGIRPADQYERTLVGCRWAWQAVPLVCPGTLASSPCFNAKLVVFSR
jgi:hypothetical protein